MPNSTEPTPLEKLSAAHRAAEAHRDKLLATKGPGHEANAAWREVSRLARDCYDLGAVRLAELLAEEARA